ncbi:MAG: hypothetical protein EBT74_07390, partial [Gammaproteobacteria bacterium]|nr:hypothetical protein [Gammaproteobacteria bacterium]
MAIGATGNDGNGPDAGHVRIYSFNGSTWNQLGLDIDGEAAGNKSGWSVSLSADGQTVAIGTPWNSDNGFKAGHVRVYSFDGLSWSQIGQDIDGEAANDESGNSISLSADGQTLAIGAYRNDGNGSNAGHVRIFSYNGSSWSQVGEDIDGEFAYDESGTSVALSANGQTIASGTPNNTNANGTYAGHVRVFGLSSASPFNYLWSTGDTTQSISVSPTQPTTYSCTVSDGNGSCIDSVFIDMPISVDSILALDANKGVYKAYFSGLDPALSYDLQFKSVSDSVWRSKTIRYPSSGQQKFNLSSLFNDTVDGDGTARDLIIDTNGTTGTILFDGLVGNSNELDAITITGNLDLDAAISNTTSISVSGTSNLGANVTTSGTQTYTGATTLSGGDRTLTGTTMNFGSTVAGGSNALAISGNLDLDGAATG